MSTLRTNTLQTTDSAFQVDVEYLANLSAGGGSHSIGYARQEIDDKITSIGDFLDASTVNVWEFEDLIVDKPNVNDHTTWNWGPAIRAAVAATPVGGVLDLYGLTGVSDSVPISKSMCIKNANLSAHTSTSIAVIYILNTSNVLVDNVNVVVDYPTLTFVNQNVSGIQADNSSYVVVVNCDTDGSKNDDYGASSWGCPIHAFNSNNITVAYCTARNAHKEGIMTRQCDDTTIAFCKAYDCGNSGVGTSRGINPKVLYCESYTSGASNISVNGTGYIVAGCIAKGNLTQNGITIGHSEDNLQWSGTGVAYGNVISNSAGWGILVADPILGKIVDNSMESCTSGGCIVTTGGPAPAGATIIFANNQCKTLSGHGFRSTLNGDHYLFGNMIDGISGGAMHGIFTDAARLNKFTNNTLRNISGRGIYSAHQSADANARSEIAWNTIISTGQSAIVMQGGISFLISENQARLFNTSAATAETGIIINAAVAGHALEADISRNLLEGTFGATANSAIYITGTPAGAGTRSLRVDGNRAPGATILVGGAPTNFDKVSLKNNRIGAALTEVNINVGAASALVVNNSNMQALGNWPQMVPLNQFFGDCYVESFNNGTLTIRNLAASAATARLVW